MMQREHFIIAMIDDDSDEADFIEQALYESNLPIQLKYFSSFEKFMNAAASQSFLPDLIIMDINLPCKDGIACIHELKADVTLSYIPVVTFSNTHCQKYEDDSVNAGAIQLFIKPTTLTEYKTIVGKFYEFCLKNSASEFEDQAVA
jgi:response regulator RpfG family c-di-GMP phosphodiesterase